MSALLLGPESVLVPVTSIEGEWLTIILTFSVIVISSHILWPPSFATCLCFSSILSTLCLWGAQEIIHEGISQAKILPTLLWFKSDHF